jgi:hypothetical protein
MEERGARQKARGMSLMGQFILDKAFPFTYHTRTCRALCCAVSGNVEKGNGVTHHARSKIYV